MAFLASVGPIKVCHCAMASGLSRSIARIGPLKMNTNKNVMIQTVSANVSLKAPNANVRVKLNRICNPGIKGSMKIQI